MNGKAYGYDSIGNRKTHAIATGGPTVYTTNTVNQYESTAVPRSGSGVRALLVNSGTNGSSRYISAKKYADNTSGEKQGVRKNKVSGTFICLACHLYGTICTLLAVAEFVNHRLPDSGIAGIKKNLWNLFQSVKSVLSKPEIGCGSAEVQIPWNDYSRERIPASGVPRGDSRRSRK